MKNLIGFFLIAFLVIACKSKAPNPTTGATYSNVNVEEAKVMISENSDLVILDVRTPGETAEGMIENAIEIDYKSSDFDSKIMELDKNKSYLVYCRSGGRSVSASEKMIAVGFTKVTNMEGGYMAWSEK